jgi:hypothetical protein
MQDRMDGWQEIGVLQLLSNLDYIQEINMNE